MTEKTKKQQPRARGFGRRSLSVVLALLMVLSTFAVMLTATSLSTGAAISYWFVSGDFNSWPSSAGSANKINGSSGSVTIPITAKSIEFKMVAYENGNQWCGNSSGSLSVGAEGELAWNSGNNIKVSLPDNTVSVTFKLAVKSGKNYVTITATTSGGSTPTPVGESSYTAKVNPSNDANSKDAIFWADATYYDYLSDREIMNGWLYPDHVGTSNFNGNIDEWYPFYIFNRDVVKSAADSNSGWQKPLYFGNFCNTYGAYDTGHHPGVNNGYNDATGSYNVTRFDYAANNSNGVYDMYTSVQGLMGSSLSNSRLQTPDGTLAPYFNEDALEGYAKVIKSAFPFRKIDRGSYMRYEFDSTNATDNVYFTWETKDGVTYPKYVNYGSGTSYGVKDGIKEFMNQTSGYGIFPFNNASSSYKGTKTNTNEELDYGFGIRMDMKFRVPSDTDVKFDFSGDDDLWMYITDDSGKSQLVLDMGGSHKQSEGVVDFNNGVATVYKVDDPTASNTDIWVQEESGWGNVVLWAWDNNNNGEWYYGQGTGNVYRFRDNLIGSAGNPLSSKTKFKICKNKDDWNGSSGDLNISDRTGKCSYTNNFSYTNTSHVTGGHCVEAQNYFDFNPSKTYTMTIFYMERGLIESNCKMGFTLTPLGNNFIVTEAVDTVNVNEGISDVVRQLSSFGFKPYESDEQLSDANYADFELANGGIKEIPDSVLGINSKVKVQQYAPQNSYLVYDTVWDYFDNVSGKLLAHGEGVTSNGKTTVTGVQTLISESLDEYDFAEFEVDYVNTTQVTDVSITKKVDDPGVDHSGETFPATVYLQFKSDQDPTAYDLKTKSGGWIYDGRVELKDGVTITIPDVPVGTHVTVVEDSDPNYTVSYSADIVAGTVDSLTVTNTPVEPDTARLDEIRKYIAMPDGSKALYESGDLFTFKAEGLDPVEYEPSKMTVSTAGMEKIVSSINANGEIIFENGGGTDQFLKLSRTGVYLFVIYETSVNGDDSVDTYNSDLSLDDQMFLARIDVTAGADGLVAGDPVYYSYDGGTINADTFKAALTAPAFNNPVTPASVTVKKVDGAKSDLSGVFFNVYKVDAEGAAIDESNAVGAAKQTGDDGICTFDDLAIYKTNANGKYSAEPEYQWYALQETRAKDGYAKSTVVSYFTLPMKDSATGELKYDITFSYENGAIKNPSTAGPGVTAFMTAGFAIILFSAALLAYYVLGSKKRVRQPVRLKK